MCVNLVPSRCLFLFQLLYSVPSPKRGCFCFLPPALFVCDKQMKLNGFLSIWTRQLIRFSALRIVEWKIGNKLNHARGDNKRRKRKSTKLRISANVKCHHNGTKCKLDCMFKMFDRIGNLLGSRAHIPPLNDCHRICIRIKKNVWKINNHFIWLWWSRHN